MNKEREKQPIQKEIPRMELGYIPFDPEKELEEIDKITDRDLKKDSLSAYKKELFEQKIGIVNLINELIDTVLRSSDIESEELKKLVYQKAPNLKLTQEQLRYFERAISRYQKQHQLIKKYQEQNISGIAIYHKLLNKYPQGEVDIKFRPMTVNLEFSDWGDYTRFTLNKTKPSKKEIESQKNEWATLIGFDIGDLTDGVVAISPKSLQGSAQEKESDMLHEETHTMIRLLLDTQLNNEAMKLIRKELALAIEADNKNLVQEKFKKYLYYELLDYLNELADEVISFYRDGTNLEEIKDYLITVGVYLPKIEKEIKESQSSWKKELGKFKGLVNERQDYLSSQIVEKLNEMFEAIKKLEDNGYSRQEIVALLMTEPPEKWLKWAYRLSEKS